jgi:hypothetical protein
LAVLETNAAFEGDADIWVRAQGVENVSCFTWREREGRHDRPEPDPARRQTVMLIESRWHGFTASLQDFYHPLEYLLGTQDDMLRPEDKPGHRHEPA